MTEPAAPTRTEPVLDSVTRADQSDELATTTLLRAAIGPVQTNYYLPRFTRFDAQDRAGISWNTAAALATLNWMMFRRMWNAALTYAGISLTLALLVFGIGKLAFHYSPELQWALAGLYALLLVGLPGFFGNALLFKHYRSDMARALADHRSIADAAAALSAQAPTRQRLLVQAVLNVVAAATVAALVLWASGFNGMSALGNPTVVDAPPPTANGKIAVGRAQEAASSPAAPTVAAPASTPAEVASNPATAVSMPAAMASTPMAALPAAAASEQQQIKRPLIELPPGLPEKKTDKAVNQASASEKIPEKIPTAQDTHTKEKTEAARLAPQAAAQSGDRKPAAKAPAPVAEKKPAAKPKPAAPVTKVPAETLALEKSGAPVGSFGINVGVFADNNNARNAFVKLSDAGLPAYTQELKGKKGKLTRVRVGPYNSLAEAERAADRIRALGLDALVFQ